MICPEVWQSWIFTFQTHEVCDMFKFSLASLYPYSYTEGHVQTIYELGSQGGMMYSGCY